MNETIEDQLRRVLAQSAAAEVPASTPIPARRRADELPRRRARRHWVAPVISGIAAAVIAVLATLLVVHQSTPTDGVARPAQVVTPQVDPTASAGVTSVAVPDLVTVPNLKTLSVVAANAQLKAFHLVMKSVGVVSTDGGKGEVVGQSPPASAQVKVGSTVTVQVGTGPNFTRLPTGLVGMTYDQAVAALKTANLTATQQVVDGTAPLNTVVKVIGVKAGAQVSEGTPIVLQTSNNHLFVVPNLAGLTVDDAAARLNTLGWHGDAASLGQYSAQTTDAEQFGKIAGGRQEVTNPDGGGVITRPGQDPTVGSTAGKTAPFKVVVYRKKQIVVPTFTPGVTTTDGAVRALQNLGASNIKVITQQPAIPPAVPQTFISMEPRGGSVVDFDAEITLTVQGDAPPTK